MLVALAAVVTLIICLATRRKAWFTIACVAGVAALAIVVPNLGLHAVSEDGGVENSGPTLVHN